MQLLLLYFSFLFFLTPTLLPSLIPSTHPSTVPSKVPSSRPSVVPSLEPSLDPSSSSSPSLKPDLDFGSNYFRHIETLEPVDMIDDLYGISVAVSEDGSKLAV